MKKKSSLYVFGLVSTLIATTGIAQRQMDTAESFAAYTGSTFAETWSRLEQEQYASLPTYHVVSAETLKSVASLAMNATLDNRADFRPRRLKLVHPNGICLAGKWEIDQPSNYSGYFAEGRKGLVVARASVTQDFVKLEDYRAFGLALKIFPTTDPTARVYTSNLFSVDTIEGTQNHPYTRALMSNQIPDFNFLNISNVIRLFDRMSFLINFNNLSKQSDSGPQSRNPLLRRTVEVARAGMTQEFSAVNLQESLPSYKFLEAEGKIKEPLWVGFEPEGILTYSNERDFRDEITDTLRKNGELRYKILVADQKNRAGKQMWSQIGSITFNSAVSSKTCDLDLHFHHPRTDN